MAHKHTADGPRWSCPDCAHLWRVGHPHAVLAHVEHYLATYYWAAWRDGTDTFAPGEAWTIVHLLRPTQTLRELAESEKETTNDNQT